jgi:acetyltransferase
MASDPLADALVSMPDGTSVTIRPIGPDDLAIETAFVRSLSPRTGYYRLFSGRQPQPDELWRFTHPDREREAALIATVVADDGSERQIAVARYVRTGNDGEAEFAIVVADAWQGRGLGSELLGRLLDCAQAAGLRRVVGIVLAENAGMLALGRRLGFDVGRDAGDATVRRLVLEWRDPMT